jgi:hypothetical protein
MIPAAELDQLLLSFCDARWRKVARVIGNTMQVLEERGVQLLPGSPNKSTSDGGPGEHRAIGSRGKHSQVAIQRSSPADRGVVILHPPLEGEGRREAPGWGDGA